MSDWREVSAGNFRIRYRHDGEEHAHFSAGHELEFWHSTREGWRRVGSMHARDWFVLGMLAGAGYVKNVDGLLVEVADVLDSVAERCGSASAERYRELAARCREAAS